jgi:hypothetical protein
MNSQAEVTQDDGKGPAPAQPRTDIGTHYLRYSVSNGVVMLLGFISFRS